MIVSFILFPAVFLVRVGIFCNGYTIEKPQTRSSEPRGCGRLYSTRRNNALLPRTIDQSNVRTKTTGDVFDTIIQPYGHLKNISMLFAPLKVFHFPRSKLHPHSRLRQDKTKYRFRRSADISLIDKNADFLPTLDRNIDFSMLQDILGKWPSDMNDQIQKEKNALEATKQIPSDYLLNNEFNALYEDNVPQFYKEVKITPVEKSDKQYWSGQLKPHGYPENEISRQSFDSNPSGAAYVYEDTTPPTVMKRVKFNSWGGKRENYVKDIREESVRNTASYLLEGPWEDERSARMLMRLLKRLNLSDIQHLGEALGYLGSDVSQDLAELRKKKTSFSAWGGKRNGGSTLYKSLKKYSPKEIFVKFLRERLGEGEWFALSDAEMEMLLKTLEMFFQRLPYYLKMQEMELNGDADKRFSFNAWGGKRSMR